MGQRRSTAACLMHLEEGRENSLRGAGRPENRGRITRTTTAITIVMDLEAPGSFVFHGTAAAALRAVDRSVVLSPESYTTTFLSGCPSSAVFFLFGRLGRGWVGDAGAAFYPLD